MHGVSDRLAMIPAMSDTTPTDRGQTIDATATDLRQTELTVADAARVLGLTSDAVRAKIRRGTMSAFKAPDDTRNAAYGHQTKSAGELARGRLRCARIAQTERIGGIALNVVGPRLPEELADHPD